MKKTALGIVLTLAGAGILAPSIVQAAQARVWTADAVLTSDDARVSEAGNRHGGERRGEREKGHGRSRVSPARGKAPAQGQTTAACSSCHSDGRSGSLPSDHPKI